MNKVFVRYSAYAFGVLVVTSVLMLVGQQLPGGMMFQYQLEGIEPLTSELSPVELLQNLLLIFCGAVFAWIASRDRLRRPMAIGFCGLFLLFLIRELDFFLDFFVMDNAWQVCGALVLSVTLVYLVRNFDRYGQGWRRSWPSAGLAMIIGGLILLIPYAQLMGHEGLWITIMGEDYNRIVKVAVEEIVELGGYAMITIGTLEFLYAWSRLPRTRNIDARPARENQARKK